MLQSTLFIGGTPEWLPSPSLYCLYSRTGVQLNESGERDMNGKQQQAHKESSTHIMRFAVRFDVYSSRVLLGWHWSLCNHETCEEHWLGLD